MTSRRSTNQPKRTTAPDFIVEQRQAPIGRVERKETGKNLDTAEESAQLQRYRTALPNLILTDYVQFRRYIDGELRGTIEQILTDDATSTPELSGSLASHREVLINDLSVADFADLQAQTAAYGLFAARCMHFGPADTFSRQSAVFADTTRFLRDVFGHIARPGADARIAWNIDDLALLFARADMASVLEDFGTATRPHPTKGAKGRIVTRGSIN